MRNHHNQYSVNPTCLLCGEDPEDQEHFLLKCRAATRDPFIKKAICVMNEYLGIKIKQDICRDSNFFIVLILECKAVDLNLGEPQRDDFLSKFESVARGLCYALHCKRTNNLNQQQ